MAGRTSAQVPLRVAQNQFDHRVNVVAKEQELARRERRINDGRSKSFGRTGREGLAAARPQRVDRDASLRGIRQCIRKLEALRAA
jgi:hypothetical protein